MGNIISSTYSGIFNTEENEKLLDVNGIRNAFIHVVHSYILFLWHISQTIVEKRTNDVEREKREFSAVKKELFNFLIRHKTFFAFKKIQLLSNNGSVLQSYCKLCNSDVFEQFMKIDNVYELQLKIKTNKEVSSIKYKFDHVEEEIIERIRIVLNKSDISDEDIQLFLENHYLVDKNDLENNCSNYKELQAYIENRDENYCSSTVSTEHIKRMSFMFQGSIKDYKDEKSCCVCLEDYKKDQEVCRLPCNPFCCRKCTEEMFAIPDDGSKANFQCPICRDDCT